MSEPRPTHALDRLANLGAREHSHEASMSMPDGSPTGQMIASIVLPGAACMGRRPLLGFVMVVVGVMAPVGLAVWAYLNIDDLVGFALDPTFLNTVILVGLALLVVRFIAVAEVAHTFRRSPGIGARTLVMTVLLLGLSVPVVYAATKANQARSMVADVFAEGDGESLFVPDFPTVDPAQVTNVLLLGGDAGPGRWGERTDSMIVVSIDKETGRTALVSVPRNLTRLMFPPGTPMADEFPNGFSDLANAVFTYVSGRPALVEHYGRSGLQPEPVALAQGIGYSLGIEIDDYALVNMQGFAEVIDAVGGVTLDLTQTVPLPQDVGDVPLEVGPGMVAMDGPTAIAYARSRAADSDYQRMGRQRQLLSALGSQVSAGEALSGFGAVTGALQDTMRTSLSSGEFSALLTRLGDNSSIGESIGLAPPLVQPGSPDYVEIQGIIDAVERYVVTGTHSGYAS
ncbi:MAG TPA: LCP family protein [Ilumatobacter sp.]|nr:LCP family protein [Ilumatobacter sp.]